MWLHTESASRGCPKKGNKASIKFLRSPIDARASRTCHIKVTTDQLKALLIRISTIPNTSIMGSSICIGTDRASNTTHITNKMYMGKKRNWQTCCWRVSCNVGMYSIKHLYNSDCFNCHNNNVTNDHKPTTSWRYGCLHSVLVLDGALSSLPDDSLTYVLAIQGAWPPQHQTLLSCLQVQPASAEE